MERVTALQREALVFLGPRAVAIVEEPIGPPPPGSVLARTAVSAISAGTELLAFRGELPPHLEVDETLSTLKGQTFTYPFRYGYAQVGDVVAVGADVDPDWLGRRIFAFAAHASGFIVPACDAILVPPGVSAERAALLAHMETAVNLVLDGQPRLGENVVVLGLGTIGFLTAALLARFPLATLAAADRDAARRAFAGERFGARVATVPAAAPELARVLGARGADLVYELTGHPDALNLATAIAGHEGRVVIGSWYGSKRGDIDLGGAFHRRRLRLFASQVSHIAPALSGRWDRARRFEAAWSALAQVDTSALVSHRFDLADAAAAYALLDRQDARQNARQDHQQDPSVRQVLLTHGGGTRA